MSVIGLHIEPVDDDRMAILHRLLADPTVREGLYPYCDGRVLTDVVLGCNDLDLKAIVLGGAVVGGVGLSFGEILIFVEPAVRGRGVARASLRLYLAELGKTGRAVVMAATARSNAASRRLLASVGFAECGLRLATRAREPFVEYRIRLASTA